jgi:two-component system, cell cycle sensor histidine kinase and response regulator CckA
VSPLPGAQVVSGRVLVVDDEAGVRAIARETLKRAGFQVTTASSGVEALGLLIDDSTFDAVLLDMTMPDMNGIEAFRLIKEHQPELPIVLTSGYSAHDAVGRIGEDRLAGFVQKPFLPATLVQTMLDAVGRRRHPL